MNTTDPQEIALEFVDCINNHDTRDLASLMTEDFMMIAHNEEPDIGREIMREGFQSYFTQFPEYKIHIEKVTRSGNAIAMVGKTTGSHVPPEIEKKETVVFIATIEGNLVAEWRIFSDMDDIE